MKFISMCFLSGALALVSGQSHAADLCNDASAQGKSQIDSTYLPKIDLWIKVSRAMKDKGLDPKKYPVIMPDGSIEVLDILDVVEKLARQRADGYGKIEAATSDCEKQIAPYQKSIDIGVFFSSGGLSAVLPPTMTHVDASQILSGHPLGGPGALLPKLRDDLLKGLGVGGDVGCFIRDPLRAIKGNC